MRLVADGVIGAARAIADPLCLVATNNLTCREGTSSLEGFGRAWTINLDGPWDWLEWNDPRAPAFEPVLRAKLESRVPWYVQP